MPAWFGFAGLGLAALAALTLPGRPAAAALALVGVGLCALVAARRTAWCACSSAVRAELRRPGGLAGANLGRTRARDALAALPDC